MEMLSRLAATELCSDARKPVTTTSLSSSPPAGCSSAPCASTLGPARAAATPAATNEKRNELFVDCMCAPPGHVLDCSVTRAVVVSRSLRVANDGIDHKFASAIELSRHSA